MAKLINGLLGNSRNKVGNLVTYVSKGQQIARSKAANIANPRTQAQMEQRTKMANLVNFYRANKVWADKLAFANKPQRWSTWNAFVHANIGTSQVYLTKTEASAGATIVAPYIVSGGSLNPVAIIESATSGLYYTDLYLGEGYDPSSQTIGQFSQALIENNNGIEAGMQLSLIENYQITQNGMPKVVVRAYEVILDPNDAHLLSTRISSANFNVVSNQGEVVVAYDTTGTGDAVGFTFVLSKTTSAGTNVSPATMVLTDDTIYQSYSDDTQKRNAIDSYGTANALPFLDSTEQAESTNGNVPMAFSLSGASTAGGNMVQPNAYFGVVDSSSSFNLFLYGSRAVDASDCTDFKVHADYSGNDVSATATSIDTDGQAIVGTFAAEAIPVNAPITRIEVKVLGSLYAVNFSTEDTGVTE